MNDSDLAEITVSCSDPDCDNYGIELLVLVDPIHPAVQCGPCGGWIVAPGTDG